MKKFKYRKHKLWNNDNNKNSLFFNKKSLEEQLFILKNYFPIGSEIFYVRDYGDMEVIIFKGLIVDYVISGFQNNLYNLHFKIIETMNNEYEVGKYTSMHPGFFDVDKKSLRNIKFKELLKDN